MPFLIVKKYSPDAPAIDIDFDSLLKMVLAITTVPKLFTNSTSIWFLKSSMLMFILFFVGLEKIKISYSSVFITAKSTFKTVSQIEVSEHAFLVTTTA